MSSKKPEEKLSENFKYVQRVIKRLLSNTPKSFPLQVKLCKQLLNQYNNKKFWLWVIPPYEIDSLLFFKGDYGKKWLDTQFLFFTQPESPREKPPTLGEKCGEDKIIIKTRKTLADYLR